MATREKESGNSGITGTVAVVGVACGFIGAVIGALGWNLWKKEEVQQQHGSRSGPKEPYNKGTCPICWSDMEGLRVLPCGHQYHIVCIESLKKNNLVPKCPLCRESFGK